MSLQLQSEEEKAKVTPQCRSVLMRSCSLRAAHAQSHLLGPIPGYPQDTLNQESENSGVVSRRDSEPVCWLHASVSSAFPLHCVDQSLGYVVNSGRFSSQRCIQRNIATFVLHIFSWHVIRAHTEQEKPMARAEAGRLQVLSLNSPSPSMIPVLTG